MKKYYFILMMAAALVACSKEQNVADPKEDTPAADQNLVPMQFTASMEDAGTKTDLNTSTGAVSWTDTDEVAFYWEVNRKDDGTKNISSATSTSTEIDGSNANFTVAVPDDFSLSDSDFTARYSAVDPSSNVSRHMYAVYPATTTVDYSSGSSLFITIPATQDGTFANASIAVAKWSAPGENLVFNNLCGLVQVVVEDAAVRKIELSSSAEIAGQLSVTFPKEGDNLGKPVEKAISGGVNTITVNVSGAGTYYIAVRPVDITDLYVALYDSSDNLIGDKMSGNTLTVARKQIRRLGTIATGFSDRMYFTVSGKGTKDGSSWDNAGDIALLKTTMTTAATKSLYLAAGDYNLGSSSVQCTAASNFKLYGGYPDNLTGYAISGRDPSNNITTLTANDTVRPFYINNASSVWLFDGVSFLCTNYSGANGGAFSLLNGKATVNNCVFDGCSNTQTIASTKGGVIRVDASGNATFKNCTFSNNSVTSHGGVFYVAGSVTINDCTFTDNAASGNGGALYIVSGGSVTATGCTFGESGHPNRSTLQGGAVYLNGGTIDLDGCTLSNNEATTNGGAIQTNGGTLTAYNCNFLENKSTKTGGTIQAAGATTIRFNQCTFVDNASVGGNTSDLNDEVNQTSNTSVLYIGGTSTIFLNGCYLGQSTASFQPSVAQYKTSSATYYPFLILTGTNAQAGFNNCVICGPFAPTGGGRLIHFGGNTVVVNTTVYSQVSLASIYRSNGTGSDACKIINSIVLNNSSSKISFTTASGYAMQVYNSIYGLSNGSGTFTATASINGKYNAATLDANAFPGTPWAQKSLGTASTSPTGRNIKVYAWDGVCDGFTKTTLADIKTLIGGTTGIGSSFLTWLESEDLKVNGVEALAVDICGNARNTSAMWPGSYEQTSGVASAPAFSVK
ncbi:MAG: right-handed parallel beta-helix repeat-containing protein [Bacteroidales bacterium]|nr:right-handed parallel beta-helix repeat-containing protein [Bacteroidales bacterium]